MTANQHFSPGHRWRYGLHAAVLTICIPGCAFATTVITGSGNMVGWGAGLIPLPPGGFIPTAATFSLVAHPAPVAVPMVGNKRPGVAGIFSAASGLLAEPPGQHGTTGEGSVSSGFLPIGANALFITRASATVNPGPREPPAAPVAFSTIATDPLIVGPGFGTMTIDVTLFAGTSFVGIPAVPSLADDPEMTFAARIAPGAISDSESFFGTVPNAIDLYTLDIRQSNISGLIEPMVTLGSSNPLFNVSFNEGFDVVRDRIKSAFSGVTGAYQVLNETLLFTLNVEPQSGLTYTFGTRQANFARDVEPIPEPSMLAVFGMAALGSIVISRRRQNHGVPCLTARRRKVRAKRVKPS